MADPLPARRSALHGHLQEGVRGATREGGPGVVLREVRLRALCQINGAPDAAALASALADLLPEGRPTPRRAWTAPELSLLWNGPGQWLAVSARREPQALLEALRGALAERGATVTDLGHARTIVRLTGPCAADVLATDCPLDIESLDAGASTGTVFGHLSIHLHCRESAAFDVYVYRSFGLALWEQLEEAALEYGCRVEPAITD